MLKRTCLPTWKLVAMQASSYPVQQERVICVLYRVERSLAGQPCEELTTESERTPNAVNPECTKGTTCTPDVSAEEALSVCNRQPLYAIGMETPEDHGLCLVGQDSEKASQLYSLLVRMEVTPCTLNDVVTDLIT